MTDLVDRPTAITPDDLAPAPTLQWEANRFVRDGERVQVLSGSLHYFRVHPAQWRDRLVRLVDLGLNTVDTYVPWNFHQSSPDSAPDFTGWRDVESFLETASDVGLDAIVRPGPYICAEWTNGGLPVWLTGAGVPLRTLDERFLAPVRAWFDHLLPRLARLQAHRGGPIIAVQVENEFGSFGDGTAYPRAVADLLRAGGITEMLFTADGPTDLMLDAGAVDGVLTALTLGSRVAAARDLVRSRRADEPLFVAEFWNGWFDHWGDPHHVRDAANAADTLAEIVADGGSVSLYMAHGGTNFGLWAGANRVDGVLRPTVTSYDSDAPIAEDGTLTAKFHAMREVLGATEPIVSTAPRRVEPQSLPVTPGLSLDESLDVLTQRVLRMPATFSFDELGMDSGLVRLRARVALPRGEVDLVLPDVADHALVRSDGRTLGEVSATGSVALRGEGRRERVDVVVEAFGRVNYGWSIGERKGLLAPVLVERRAVQEWEADVLDLPGASRTTLAWLASVGLPDVAGAASAVLHLDEPGDAHLALPGFGRGYVWVNGFLLGRYWSIGPQQTLYVPGPLLQAGRNDIVVLEMERRGDRIEVREHAELGPREEYIESF